MVIRVRTPWISNMHLELDFVAAEAHLCMLDSATDKFLFAAFDERNKHGARPWHYFGTLADVASDLSRLQSRGYGVFVTVNSTIAGRRRAVDVTVARAVWADFDQPPTCPAPLRPSLRIRSSPGRGQAYWLVDPRDPLLIGDAVRINREIACRHGADRAATDAARVLRLAGTWHQKGHPVRVEIVGGTGVRYGAGALQTAWPAPLVQPLVQPSRRPPLRPATGGLRHPARYVDAVVRAEIAELHATAAGRRNSALNATSFRLGQLGLGVDDVSSLVGSVAAAIGLSPSEIIKTIRSGVTAGHHNLRWERATS